MNEYILGRKRILVPYSRPKWQMQNGRKCRPGVDPNDTVYFALPGDRDSDLKLTEVDMTIRAQDHETGINKALDLMSLKCGMGTGRYKFEAGGVKTATEVISDKSELVSEPAEKTRFRLMLHLSQWSNACTSWKRAVMK